MRRQGDKNNIKSKPVSGTDVIGTHQRAIFGHSSGAAENVAGAESSRLGRYLEPGQEQHKLVRTVRVCVDPVLLSVKYKRIKTVHKNKRCAARYPVQFWYQREAVSMTCGHSLPSRLAPPLICRRAVITW